jgi:hypothetical protein
VLPARAGTRHPRGLAEGPPPRCWRLRVGSGGDAETGGRQATEILGGKLAKKLTAACRSAGRIGTASNTVHALGVMRHKSESGSIGYLWRPIQELAPCALALLQAGSWTPPPLREGWRRGRGRRSQGPVGVGRLRCRGHFVQSAPASQAHARVRGSNGLRRSQARVAASFLRAAGDLLLGLGRGRRRTALRQGPDQPLGRRRRARPHGHGDHPVHGRRLRRPPESRCIPCVCHARRLPLDAPAGLHHHPARRSDPGSTWGPRCPGPGTPTGRRC